MKKQIFAGAGLGLLVGGIIGLSISETTGIILGALTSLLAAFFGLRSSKDGEEGNQLVIGSFGFACIMGIVFGIFVRTHQYLAPSIKSEMSAYLEAGFDSTEAKEIILISKFGIKSEGIEVVENTSLRNTTSGNVFSGQGHLDVLCTINTGNPEWVLTEEEIRALSIEYQEMIDALRIAIESEPIRKEIILLFIKAACGTH